MKANELRIGNRVNINGEVIAIKSIEFNPASQDYYIRVCYPHNYIQLKVEALEPISLTEEWLLKFGFKNKDKKKNWIYSAYGLKINNGKIISGLGGKMVCVEYVHQLQNIYFALTNEELTIK